MMLRQYWSVAERTNRDDLGRDDYGEAHPSELRPSNVELDDPMADSIEGADATLDPAISS